MGIRKYFFDTYAFYEFINGNKKYIKYFKNYAIITTRFNLIELFYILLKDFDLETTRKYYKEFIPFTIEFSDEVIEKAMLFRLKHKKQDLSYIDCMGYIYSILNGIKFLTGDKEFKNFPNIEFVK